MDGFIRLLSLTALKQCCRKIQFNSGTNNSNIKMPSLKRDTIPKYLVSKATIPILLDRTWWEGSKKRWLLNKIWVIKTVFHCKGLGAAFIFILLSCLSEIIAQSARGSAKHFFESMWRLSGNGCLVTFCTFGYCAAAIWVPNELISPIHPFL